MQFHTKSLEFDFWEIPQWQIKLYESFNSKHSAWRSHSLTASVTKPPVSLTFNPLERQKAKLTWKIFYWKYFEAHMSRINNLKPLINAQSLRIGWRGCNLKIQLKIHFLPSLMNIHSDSIRSSVTLIRVNDVMALALLHRETHTHAAELQCEISTSTQYNSFGKEISSVRCEVREREMISRHGAGALSGSGWEIALHFHPLPSFSSLVKRE